MAHNPATTCSPRRTGTLPERGATAARKPASGALRGARAQAAHALAAQIARLIARMALAALGLSGDPVHEPVHVQTLCPAVRDHSGRGASPRPRPGRAGLRRLDRQAPSRTCHRAPSLPMPPGLRSPRSAATCCAPPEPWPASPAPEPHDATLRRDLIHLADCTARHGRSHLTVHLPEGWHREHEWMNPVRSCLRAARRSGLTSADRSPRHTAPSGCPAGHRQLSIPQRTRTNRRNASARNPGLPPVPRSRFTGSCTQKRLHEWDFGRYSSRSISACPRGAA
jgi:hypothetical protein